MAVNSGDANDLVDEALSQCEVAFKRGVHSFHEGQQSDLHIRPAVIDRLKAALRGPFQGRLGGDDGSKIWDREGGRVVRTGFHAGALAAFHAYTGHSEWVECPHADVAMAHVREHCRGPADTPRPAWVYCPWP